MLILPLDPILAQTPERPKMQIRLIVHRGRASRFFVGVLLLCAALLHAVAGSAGTPSPVKLAIFDFELEDLSAGPGESPADTLLLKQITSDARRMIAASGRYSLVDISGADAEAVKGRWLHRCHGCDAGIALKLGAEQSFVGFVTRISRAEYMVRVQISDTQTGAVISDIQTGLRMGADDSWNRGVGSLINGRLLSNQN
jgi:hypothetical protein